MAPRRRRTQARSKAEAIWRQLGLAWCLWLALSTPALGQALELGGSIGTAARGSEGALVRSPWYTSPGVYANIAWTQRLETTIRVVWVQLGSRQSTSGYFNGCQSGRRDCRPAVAYYIVERSRKLPRQVDSREGDWSPDEGLGRNVSGGTRPRLSWGRTRL